nr:hypothetical protein [Tanacetum cinerariifolium]
MGGARGRVYAIDGGIRYLVTKVDDWEFKCLFGVLLIDNVEEERWVGLDVIIVGVDEYEGMMKCVRILALFIGRFQGESAAHKMSCAAYLVTKGE